MRGLHRLRRAHRSRRDAPSGPLLSVLAICLSASALGGLAAGSTLLGLAAELPEVSRIEGQFGLRGAEAFRPVLLYDRTGEVVLLQNLAPAAADRVWVDPPELPQHVVQTTLAALDPTFWTNPGYVLRGLADGSSATITQRLTAATLLPPATGEASPAGRTLQNVLLAAELTRRYPKERILAWYLNSADYGRSAFGIDAAGLVYFGRHAADLSLAESSMLAALALEPELDLLGSPESAKSRQAAVLDRTVATAGLSRAEADRAGNQPLRFQSASMAWQPPDFASYALEQIRSLMGPGILSRSGVRVILSLDNDLQQQAACAAESHAERLRGSLAGTVIPASDGTPCVAAALLPTLRPSDVGLDHQLEAWGVVVTDPQRGEILAASGPVRQARPAGPVLSPFLYLTAFSRGSSPSTMVNDLGPPLEGAAGPVRMRTALAGLLPGPETNILAALGEDNLLRSLAQLGLPAVPSEDGELRSQRVSLLDLAKAYGVLAADGRSRGLQLPDGSIVPTIVLRVEESDGKPLFHFEPGEQAIVSPQLAYLLVAVLSDEPARWSSLGSPNLLEIGRPAGVLSGSSPEQDTNWAIGFTPNRVVGVFLSGTPLSKVDRLNGAASLWHAIIRFGSAGLPAQGWDLPPGLSEIEVCDPSGLLPTAYCPEVVREVFIQGSEPSHYDNLYQPFRVNAETGKLATLFTPLASIEERVYFVPPPEAGEWAQAVGLERPPEEFDALPSAALFSPGARILFPSAFDIVGAEIPILGEAAAEGFSYYRLQYGQGLNPTRWIQIEGDRRIQVQDGRLALWSTEGLNGLYTLQLLVILRDGQVRTAAMPLTLDNQPPSIQLLLPQPGTRIRVASQATLLLQAEAGDEVKLERVEFLVNGRPVETMASAPFLFNWVLPNRIGSFEIRGRAYDAAGNQAESEPVTIEITP